MCPLEPLLSSASVSLGCSPGGGSREGGTQSLGVEGPKHLGSTSAPEEGGICQVGGAQMHGFYPILGKGWDLLG